MSGAPLLNATAVVVGAGDLARGVRAIRLDMSRTDAGSDHRDADLASHRRLPSRVAIASAFRASSITLKQCDCGIARSVRSSTSATRFAE